MPSAIIITTAGTNCDRELVEAFLAAGADAESVHLNKLMHDPSILGKYTLIGLPGGFSYGDAIAAGRIAAQLMKQTLYPAFQEAIGRGVPIIAPCNGFQVAVQMGILPGPVLGEKVSEVPPRAEVTLAANASARFTDCWTRIEIPTDTRCIWTRGLVLDEEEAILPSAHGEGRFIAASEEVLDRVHASGQVALRYVEGDNFNGSDRNIAGICDATGLVFGLMPHPERYTAWTQHPYWTRLDEGMMQHETPGLRMFRNAVEHAAAIPMAR